MSAIASFIKGLFTKHLGTKFLSLMLAALLFFFTEQSLSGLRKLREVTLSFQLDRGLADEFVLLDDRVVLHEVTIKGKIVEVDRSVRTLANSSDVVTVDVNRAFLESYGSGAVPITKSFCEQLAIFGEKVEVELAQETSSVLNIARKITDVYLRPVLADGQESKLRLPADHPYQPLGGEGDISITFEPASVNVTGPDSAFGEAIRNQSLRVVIRDLAQYLTEAQPDATRIRLPVESIDWAVSGVDLDLAQHIRIRTPQEMRVREFEDSLLVSFQVERRWRVDKLPSALPIVELRPRGMPDVESAFEYIEAPDIYSFEPRWLDKHECKGMLISAPVSLWERPEDLKLLTLVLDYGNMQEIKDGDQTITIFVPVRLGVKNPDRLDLLRQVKIVGRDQKPATNPRLRWDRTEG